MANEKRCFLVSVSVEVLVIATSPEEARSVAKETRAIEDSLGFYTDWDASEAKFLPSDYENDTFVYHNGKGDITASEALRLNPSYVASLERLEKAKTSLL